MSECYSVSWIPHPRRPSWSGAPHPPPLQTFRIDPSDLSGWSSGSTRRRTAAASLCIHCDTITVQTTRTRVSHSSANTFLHSDGFSGTSCSFTPQQFLYYMWKSPSSLFSFFICACLYIVKHIHFSYSYYIYVWICDFCCTSFFFPFSSMLIMTVIYLITKANSLLCEPYFLDFGTKRGQLKSSCWFITVDSFKNNH